MVTLGMMNFLKVMKSRAWTCTAAALAVVLSGCVNPNGTPNNTGTGVLAGSAFGALTGAAIGGCRNAGPYALYGAAAGALAGGLLGYAADRQQNAWMEAQAPQPTYVRVNQVQPQRPLLPQPMSIADVKGLVGAGVSDDVIISQINNSRTVFHLSAADIIDLRYAGVSDKLINYMINTPTMFGAVAATTQPAPTYIQTAPPPPVVQTAVVAPGSGYVWIGGEWVWRGGWFWVGGHWAYPPYPRAMWVSGRSWQDAYGWHYAPGYWR